VRWNLDEPGALGGMPFSRRARLATPRSLRCSNACIAPTVLRGTSCFTASSSCGRRAGPLREIARLPQSCHSLRSKRVRDDVLQGCETAESGSAGVRHASGQPISPNNVLRRSIFPVCDQLGLPRATWLTFRRTYSSWSHDKGVPGKVVAQLMGHANVDTTLNVYTQVLDGSVRAVVEKIGDELFTGPRRPMW